MTSKDALLLEGDSFMGYAYDEGYYLEIAGITVTDALEKVFPDHISGEPLPRLRLQVEVIEDDDSYQKRLLAWREEQEQQRQVWEEKRERERIILENRTCHIVKNENWDGDTARCPRGEHIWYAKGQHVIFSRLNNLGWELPDGIDEGDTCACGCLIVRRGPQK